MHPRRSYLALTSLLLLVAVGCGRVVTLENDSQAQNLGDRDGGGPDSSGNEAGFDAGTDAVAPATCATYTPGYDAVPNGGHVGAGSAFGCRVAVDVDPGADYPLIMKDGVAGKAVFTGDVLTFTCNDATTQLMAATIRCYQGPGDYEVPAGALVLGTHVSDRKCRLGVDYDVAAGHVAGFIDCETSPADPNNVFANTVAPIGLGTYTLLPQK